MRWSIRNQILVPFAILQFAAVAALTFAAVLFSVRRVERETLRRLDNVVVTLRDSSFPLTENVLLQMRGLSGAEFAVLDAQSQVVVSTLTHSLTAIPQQALAAHNFQATRFPDDSPIQVGGRQFLPTRVSGLSSSGSTDLLILFPEDQWREARQEAIVAPLVVGGLTLCGMMLVSAWLASRFGRRIQTIQQQFTRIGEGDFELLDLTDRNDELSDLSRSANHLATALERLTDSIRRQEREAMASQLVGGIAHQFRNALTGARMAIQLHMRRCPSVGDESLDVALRQLSLTEQQIKGLLRITSDDQRSVPSEKPASGQLGSIVQDVVALVSPLCDHENVQLDVPAEIPLVTVADRDALCAALLNLVLNAIEAAGPHGTVSIALFRNDDHVIIEISDTGNGVADQVAATLFDPFVTSKPEGVGLGLALAIDAARQHGGTVSYRREAGRTVFSLSIAAAADTESPQVESIPPTELPAVVAGSHNS